jgi:hypothetical protein
MRVNPTYLSNSVAPVPIAIGMILLPRQMVGAVGRRAGAVFFALPSRQFYRDTKLTTLSRVPIAPDSYRDGRQKTRHRDPSLRSGQAPTAPNQTAGPLAVMSAS